jgi:hypothetical protein
MKPLFKFNGGYGAILCHRCRIIIKGGVTEETTETSNLLYCDKCWEKLYKEWLELRSKTKDDEGKLCYCGHTYKCECGDPDFETFKTAVISHYIKLGDPDNGWIHVIP